MWLSEPLNVVGKRNKGVTRLLKTTVERGAGGYHRESENSAEPGEEDFGARADE